MPLPLRAIRQHRSLDSLRRSARKTASVPNTLNYGGFASKARELIEMRIDQFSLATFRGCRSVETDCEAVQSGAILHDSAFAR